MMKVITHWTSFLGRFPSQGSGARGGRTLSAVPTAPCAAWERGPRAPNTWQETGHLCLMSENQASSVGFWKQLGNNFGVVTQMLAPWCTQLQQSPAESISKKFPG